MAGLSLSSAMTLGLSSRGGGGGATVLVREPDGTVTITSLGPTWSPNLTREPDGTVTVGA
jgi:hypothetical protein